jgi:hypothetical protein
VAFALELDDPPVDGVWGGTSKRERRALRRERRRLNAAQPRHSAPDNCHALPVPSRVSALTRGFRTSEGADVTIDPSTGEADARLLFITENQSLVTDLMRERSCTIGGTTYGDLIVLPLEDTPGRSAPDWSVRGKPTTITPST